MTQAYSSFGPAGTTTGPDRATRASGSSVNVMELVTSDRVRALKFRASYFQGKQHDWKMFDFYGRMIQPGGISVTQPLIGGYVPEFYVPLDQRRPSSPYLIGHKIVISFTELLFGHGRFPQFRSDDHDTQDFAEAIVQAASLEPIANMARDVAGSRGSVGYSYAWVNGKPRVKRHLAENIHVIEWQGEDDRVPAHVVEVKTINKRVVRASGKVEKVAHWRRRDWLVGEDVIYKDLEVTSKEPEWVVDEEQSSQHGRDACRFVFVENEPDTDDNTYDGLPDFGETFLPMNALDVINSVLDCGTARNLDPTLVMRMDPEMMGPGAVIKKGSDNALFVGKDGDAKYLQLDGQMIASATGLCDAKRDQILEVCSCILVDPDKAAAAGLSSVAIRIIYAPMTARCDKLRYQHGKMGIERVVQGLIDEARWLLEGNDVSLDSPEVPASKASPIQRGEGAVDEEEIVEPEEELEVEVTVGFDLPPRIDPVLDDAGKEVLDDAGEPKTVEVERTPGQGRIWLEWGPYFKPTADDLQKTTGTLSAAAGNKAVLSQQSAVQMAANQWDLDGTEEYQRVQDETERAARLEVDQWGTSGGRMPKQDENTVVELDQGATPQAGSENDSERPTGAAGGGKQPAPEAPPDEDEPPVPPGKEPAEPEEQPAADVAVLPVGTVKAKSVELSPTTVGMILRVNEAREIIGQGPLMTMDGQLDPDGWLTVSAFDAKNASMYDASAKVQVEQAKHELAKEDKAAEPPAPPPVPGAPPRNPGVPSGPPPA